MTIGEGFIVYMVSYGLLIRVVYMDVHSIKFFHTTFYGCHLVTLKSFTTTTRKHCKKKKPRSFFLCGSFDQHDLQS